jgi:uncharacterized protein involved in cysteine biosynthesis
MEFITNFIDWIKNLIDSVVDFFTGFVENLVLLFKYIGIAANMAYDLIAGLPDWLQVFGTVTIIVSVIFMILGRDTGGDKSD